MSIQSLEQRFPIVNPDGTPSEYFLRLIRDRGSSQLSTDEALTLLQQTVAGKADKTIDLAAGAGLTGGGDLSANRTFTVGAGTGITVNADDIALANTAVTPGSYTNTDLTVDAQGRITAAANGSGNTFAGARASRSTALTGVNYTTATAVPWNAEDFDTSTFYSSGSPTIFTIPVAGYYDLEAWIAIGALTAGQWARTFVTINGTATQAPGVIFDAAQLATGITTYLRAALRRVSLAVNDTVAIQVQVQSDTSIDIGAGCWMEIRKTP